MTLLIKLALVVFCITDLLDIIDYICLKKIPKYVDFQTMLVIQTLFHIMILIYLFII